MILKLDSCLLFTQNLESVLSLTLRNVHADKIRYTHYSNVRVNFISDTKTRIKCTADTTLVGGGGCNEGVILVFDGGHFLNCSGSIKVYFKID